MSRTFLFRTLGIFLLAWFAIVFFPAVAPRREVSHSNASTRQFDLTPAGIQRKKGVQTWKAGNLDEAEKYLRRSIDISPWADTQEMLAKVLSQKGDDRKAFDYYRAIVHPDLSKSGSTAREQPDVLLKYAQLCDKFGEKEEAEETYRRIVGLHKTYRNLPSFSDGETNPKRLRAQALTVAGVYYTQKARDFNDDEARKDALATFDEAIRLEPSGSAVTYRQKVLAQKPKAAQ